MAVRIGHRQIEESLHIVDMTIFAVESEVFGGECDVCFSVSIDDIRDWLGVIIGFNNWSNIVPVLLLHCGIQDGDEFSL